VVVKPKNYHVKYFLTLVFASILVTFGASINQVFAMGDAPSTCSNRYDGSIVSFLINNGSQTFDPIANPGVAFNVNTFSNYSVTFVIHTSNMSSQNNTNPGTTWYHDDVFAFADGHCIPDSTTTNINPNQNVTLNRTLTNPHGGYYQQSVFFSTFSTLGNPVTYNVQWIAPPSAPQNLNATISSPTTINLRWAAPSSSGGSAITSYNIYRSTTPGDEGTTPITSVNGSILSHNDTGLTTEQTYYYTVTAVNSIGESIPSNEASATPTSTATVPQPPTNLSVTATSPSQINLSWTAPTNNGGSEITGYQIERSTDSGSTWSTLVANTGSTSTKYSDTGLHPSTAFTYRVSAINSAGTSSPSNTASATTSSNTTIPSSPTGLNATAISSSQINLSWTAPSNNGGSAITGYYIERSTDNGNTWSSLIPDTSSTATTYNDTGLSPSTTYAYRVSAINSVGTSLPSDTSSATTKIVTSTGIVLNNIQSTSGAVSSSNQITLADFDVGTGTNKLLVVGVSADSSDVASVTFGGVSLTKKVGSFYNNDAEFWYLENPTGSGAIVVTMNGPTSTVVGAYSFAGVNQTSPMPTKAVRHNVNPNSPIITLTTKFANDWMLDLPSMYGGSTLGSPTCTQQWDANVPNVITGASSSKIVPTPGAVTCKWTANTGDLWDDVAIEIKASK
jgi:hypothetical protein